MGARSGPLGLRSNVGAAWGSCFAGLLVVVVVVVFDVAGCAGCRSCDAERKRGMLVMMPCTVDQENQKRCRQRDKCQTNLPLICFGGRS